MTIDFPKTDGDYLYSDAWVDFLVSFIESGQYSNSQLLKFGREGTTLNIEDCMSSD